MSVYRFKQFIWAITAHFKSVDKDITKQYLNRNEQLLFDQLKVEDKHHCIRVCNAALNKSYDSNLNRRRLAKIALLHDVGKSNKGLNVIDKSILVILDKMSKGKLVRYDKYSKVNIYYNHPKESVKLLEQIDTYDSVFLEAIEKHHYKDIGSNIYLKIIKECDDES